MDFWDPAVVDGFARERPVVLFDNAGVSRSGGATPDTVHKMANDAAAFIGALGLTQVDLLGFSLGGFVAQVLVGDKPHLVRRIILAGTGPEGGDGIANLPQVVAKGSRRLRRSRGCFSSSIAPGAANVPAAHLSRGSDGVHRAGPGQD